MDVTLTGRYYQPNKVKYFVTEDGEIFRKVQVQSSTRRGYLNCQLGRSVRWYVHRLVCTLWHGEPEEGQVCRHLDNDTSNNHWSNLAWGSHSDNAKDTRNANYSSHQKITMEIANEIRELAKQKPYGYRPIAAKKYGITENHVTDIVHRRSWT